MEKYQTEIIEITQLLLYKEFSSLLEKLNLEYDKRFSVCMY